MAPVMDKIVPLFFFYKDAFAIAWLKKNDIPVNKESKPNISNYYFLTQGFIDLFNFIWQL